jgi:hypothetical protein
MAQGLGCPGASGATQRRPGWWWCVGQDLPVVTPVASRACTFTAWSPRGVRASGHASLPRDRRTCRRFTPPGCRWQRPVAVAHTRREPGDGTPHAGQDARSLQRWPVCAPRLLSGTPSRPKRASRKRTVSWCMSSLIAEGMIGTPSAMSFAKSRKSRQIPRRPAVDRTDRCVVLLVR